MKRVKEFFPTKALTRSEAAAQPKKKQKQTIKAIAFLPADISASQYGYMHMILGKKTARGKMGLCLFSSLKVFSENSFCVELRLAFLSVPE